MNRLDTVLALVANRSRTYREIGEAVGLTAERVGQLVRLHAPEISRDRVQHLTQPSPPVELTCQQCGEGFELAAWRVRQGMGKYCSRRCKGLAMRDENSISAQAYRLRLLGHTWLAIASRLSAGSEQRVQAMAKQYAVLRGYQWPVKR